MSDPKRQYQYTEDFIAGLQWIWGEGYLSPGGPEEVAELLRGVSVDDCDVLDIGSGLGELDILLATVYGARTVLGIDVEAPLIDHAQRRAADTGLGDRVRFQLVEPGPFPFNDNSFDIVFSKDSIIHISDKKALYTDVFRVLKPGGVFAGSDWLRGGEGEYSQRALEWLEVVHLRFDMKNLAQTQQGLAEVGFEKIQLRDRNEWYREEIKKELGTLAGNKYDELVRRIGSEKAAQRLKSSSLKQQVIEEGFLRPTHFIGYKSAE